jgi:hypothetical protein
LSNAASAHSGRAGAGEGQPISLTLERVSRRITSSEPLNQGTCRCGNAVVFRVGSMDRAFLACIFRPDRRGKVRLSLRQPDRAAWYCHGSSRQPIDINLSANCPTWLAPMPEKQQIDQSRYKRSSACHLHLCRDPSRVAPATSPSTGVFRFSVHLESSALPHPSTPTRPTHLRQLDVPTRGPRRVSADLAPNRISSRGQARPKARSNSSPL